MHSKQHGILQLMELMGNRCASQFHDTSLGLLTHFISTSTCAVFSLFIQYTNFWQVLSTVNAVHMKVASLQQQQYDKGNPEHVALLDSLWRALKPDSRREDWGEIGFQNGLVPESDFRGMGMLGELFKGVQIIMVGKLLDVMCRRRL